MSTSAGRRCSPPPDSTRVRQGWRSVAPDDLLDRGRRGSPPAGAGRRSRRRSRELFQVLWDIAQPLYKLEGAPLNPARAAPDVAPLWAPTASSAPSRDAPAGGSARTVPTTRLGSVAIPAAGGSRGGRGARAADRRGRGIAGAGAVVEGAARRPAAALIERGRAQGLSFVVEVWGDARATVVDAEAHRTRAAAALATPGVTVLEVPVDYSPTERLIAAAGPLVAWA